MTEPSIFNDEKLIKIARVLHRNKLISKLIWIFLRF